MRLFGLCMFDDFNERKRIFFVYFQNINKKNLCLSIIILDLETKKFLNVTNY